MKRDMNEAAQWRDLLHKKDREIEALHRQIDWLTQQLRRARRLGTEGEVLAAGAALPV